MQFSAVNICTLNANMVALSRRIVYMYSAVLLAIAVKL